MSVRLKLVLGFLLLVALMAVQGGYAYLSLGDARDNVTGLYEGPMKEISAARSAGTHFAQSIAAAKQATSLSQDLGSTADIQAVENSYAAFAADLDLVAGILREHGGKEEILSAIDALQSQASSWKQQVGLFIQTSGGSAGVVQSLPNPDLLDEASAQVVAGLGNLAATLVEEGNVVRQAAEASVEQAASFTMILTGVAAALALLVAYLLAGSFVRPLNRGVSAAEQIAAGHLDNDLSTRRSDELGRLLHALEAMQSSLAERQRQDADEATEKEHRRAEEERRNRHLSEKVRAFEAIISNISENLSDSGEHLQATATTLNDNASHGRTQSTELNSSSNEVSRNANTVAETTEALENALEEIASRVAHSADLAGRAATHADKTNGVMAGLESAGDQIGDIVNLITDIAAQTNLLALNATIEASRAGEAGKGFAVVASEVKNLATQTTKATDSIESQVETIQGAARDAVLAIREIAELISEMNGVASDIAEAITAQSHSTREVGANIRGAASGAAVVSRQANEVQGVAETTGKAANDLSTAVEGIGKVTGTLRNEVEKFISDIRSAA